MSQQGQDKAHFTKNTAAEGSKDPPQKECPMKVNTTWPGRCDRDKCGWWSTYHSCCAIEAVALAMQSIRERMDKPGDY